MKTHIRHLLTAVLLFLPAWAGAQTITSAVPDQISYQGVVTDAGGTPVGNVTPENRTIIFRIWGHATNSTASDLIYSEQQVVTISKGEFSVLVGDGTAVVGNPLNHTPNESTKGKPTVTIPTAFGGTTRFIGVSVYDSGGAVAPEISPRQRVVSSAFAYRARFAESVGTNGTTALTTVNGGQVGIGNTAPPALLTVTGSNTGTSTNTPQMILTDGADTNERLLFGVDNTGNSTGFIQATKVGTGAQNLLLNPNGGFVGIGTSTPAFRLHVQDPSAQTGRIQVGGTTAGADAKLISFGDGDRVTIGEDSVDNRLQMKGTEYRFLGAANEERMFINSAGNIGIGTTTPTSKLQINGGNVVIQGSAAADSIGFSITSNTTAERLTIGMAGAAGVYSSGAAIGDVVMRTASTGKLLLQSGSGASAICINTNNNVGIGTTGPGERLTVVGSGSDGTTSALSVFNSSIASLLWVRNDGNVGIGTTAPGQRLDVIGGTQSQWHEIRVNNGTPYLDFSGTTAADYHARIIYMGTTDNRLAFDAAAFTFVTGNVGIATATPGAKLHVVGSDAAQLRLQTTGAPANTFWNIYTQGSTGHLAFQTQNLGVTALLTTAGAWTNGSDARLKTDVTTMDHTLEQAMKLRPVNYRLKALGADSALQIGFIAQEVQKIAPEVVVVGDKGMLSIAYAQMVPIAIGAVQQLKKEKDTEIKALQRENAELWDENKDLKARLTALEANDKARDAKLAAIEKLLLDGEKAQVQPVSLKKSAGGAE